MPFFGGPGSGQQISQAAQGCNQKNAMAGARFQHETFVLRHFFEWKTINDQLGNNGRSGVNTMLPAGLLTYERVFINKCKVFFGKILEIKGRPEMVPGGLLGVRLVNYPAR